MSTLVISKHYKKLYQLQQEHKWGKVPQDLPVPIDWVGKRVGIAGYGSIGRHSKYL
jgi:phosphoglycerate dehydrogenase-like enzyme